MIHVGCTGTPVPRQRYLAALSALEVVSAQGVPPRPETARRWAEEAPEGFVHTLVAPPALSREPEQMPPGLEGTPDEYGGLRPTPRVLELYRRTVEAAAAMRAAALVLVTPSSVPPGPRGQDVMRRFFEAVGPRPEGLAVAWEPHGPWDGEEAARLAAELGLVAVVDPLRDPVPPGRVAYARLGPFACMGRSLADDELETIVEVLAPFEEAYCFLQTDRAFPDARRLRKLVERGLEP